MLLALLVGAAGATGPVRSAPAASPQGLSRAREFAIKAAFLLQFVRYITWPKAKMPPDAGRIRIAVVGPDPFGKVLDTAFAGKKLHGRPVEVVRLGELAKLRDLAVLRRCHVLFVACKSAADRRIVLRSVANAPVLTVSDRKAFARDGGAIQLFVAANKVRFDIRRKRLVAAGLSASSKLLRLSRPVPEDQQ